MTFVLLLIACSAFAALQEDGCVEPCRRVQPTVRCEEVHGERGVASAGDLIDSEKSVGKVAKVYYGFRRWSDRVDLGRKCVGAAFVVVGSVSFCVTTTLLLYSVVQEPAIAPLLLLGGVVCRKYGWV